MARSPDAGSLISGMPVSIRRHDGEVTFFKGTNVTWDVMGEVE